MIEKYIKKILKEEMKKEKVSNKEIVDVLEKNKDNKEFIEKLKKFKEMKEKHKNKINEETENIGNENNANFTEPSWLIIIKEEDIKNLNYPEDYVDETGRLFKIPHLDIKSPYFFTVYEDMMVYRKKYPEYFKKIMMGE